VAPSPDEQTALLRAARSQRDGLIDRAVTGMTALWDVYGPGGEADWAAFWDTASWLMPQMMSGVASMTAAFMDRWALDGTSSGLIDTANGLRSVSLAEEMYRAWADYQRHVAKGWDPAEALADARQRLERIVRTDMQLAQTRQAQASLQAHGFAGFQRVPAGASSCALCLLAAGQLYHTSVLMPIHVSCDCGIAPVESGQQPQWYGTADAIRAAILELDDDTFNRALDADGELNYRAVRLAYSRVVEIHQHGDIGPVLTKRGDHFTGPAEVQQAIDAAR